MDLALEDEFLARQLPHNLEAEQAVLGSMLIDQNCIKDVMDKLQPGDFYLQQNRDIFETMYTMFSYSRPIDPVTVVGEMQKNGTFDENTTQNYIIQLMDITPTSANVMEYVALVRGKSLLRSVATAAGEITSMVREGSGDPEDVLEVAEQKIYAVRQGRSSQDMASIGTVLSGVLENIEQLSAEGGRLPGISSGFSAIDAKLSGLNKSDLILLAARPGMGKTSFALNIANHVAVKEKKRVAFFSLEMTKEQLASRMLSTEGEVGGTKLRTGKLTEDEWVRLIEAGDILSKTQIYFDDTPGITVPEMKAKLRRLKDVDLVIIDYLQLMSGAKRIDNRVQEISEITRNLKIMAKEINVPVITLSQLSRASEQRTEHRPVLSDLRDSGSIEQDADIVLFLYRPDYYNTDDAPSDDKNSGECIVAKNRHGEARTVQLHWQGEFMRFTAMEGGRSDY